MAVCGIFDVFSQGSNKREGKKGEESIFKVSVGSNFSGSGSLLAGGLLHLQKLERSDLKTLCV